MQKTTWPRFAYARQNAKNDLTLCCVLSLSTIVRADRGVRPGRVAARRVVVVFAGIAEELWKAELFPQPPPEHLQRLHAIIIVRRPARPQ